MMSCKHALLFLAFMAPLIISTHAAATITWSLQGTTSTGASTATYPGARYSATTWVDSNGNLWMFSGVGKENTTVEGYLNQLYQYSVSANTWTLVSGSIVQNTAGSYPASFGGKGTPGGRRGTARWVDQSGNLYLFGGQGIGSAAGTEGALNDFWQYSTSASAWTWLGGQSTVNAVASANVTTFPSPRVGPSHWSDRTGLFYLFGGKGYNKGSNVTALLNDLWTFNPNTSVWTQITTTSSPNGRSYASAWSDSEGNGYVYGGSDLSGIYYSDLWQYLRVSNTWVNRAGSTSSNQLPIFPTTTLSGNPGGLYAASSFQKSGQLYMFGGYGLTTTSSFSANSDLWSFSSNTTSWTYVYGNPGVVIGSLTAPGARYGAALWHDKSGNVIIFGGNGYDSTGLSTTGILGDTRLIQACSFNSTCGSGSTNNATTTGALTSSTGTSVTTGALTSTSGGGTVTTTTATVNLTLGMSGDPTKVNTSAIGGSVASGLGIDKKFVNTSVVVSGSKRAVEVNFFVLISIFFPNSTAISTATGGAGGNNLTAQLSALQAVVTAVANSSAVTNTIKAQNLTVTSVNTSASGSVVVVSTTSAKSTTAAVSTTTSSTAPSLIPTFAPLTQVVFAFAACVCALFLCTN